MTDRSLNLVVWRVRVASDYRLISTKSSILDALCGAELLMSADDSGATPTGAVRRRLSLQVYPGLLRHGYSAQNSQAVFWLFAVLAPTPTRSPTISSASSCFGCGLPLVRQAGGSCFRDLSLPVVRKANPTPIASAAARLQAGGDFAKGAAEIGSDGPHHYNGSNGNQCRDQAVLDRRNTFLIFDQTPQAQ